MERLCRFIDDIINIFEAVHFAWNYFFFCSIFFTEQQFFLGEFRYFFLVLFLFLQLFLECSLAGWCGYGGSVGGEPALWTAAEVAHPLGVPEAKRKDENNSCLQHHRPREAALPDSWGKYGVFKEFGWNLFGWFLVGLFPIHR